MSEAPEESIKIIIYITFGLIFGKKTLNLTKYYHLNPYLFFADDIIPKDTFKIYELKNHPLRKLTCNNLLLDDIWSTLSNSDEQRLLIS